MQKVNTGYHVGVFGHYGHRNLGDEAITEAVIQNLRSRWPLVSVTGFSMNPEDTARRYGIRAYPIRRLVEAVDQTPSSRAPVGKASHGAPVRDFLKQFAVLRTFVHLVGLLFRLPREMWFEFIFLRDSYGAATGVDFFFIAGSGQLLDSWGGVWGFPYTVLKWTLLARLAGARVVFLSVGAGPIDSLLSRIMVRAALSLADYASFRDPSSRKLVDWFASGGRWQVYPDLAQSFLFERQAATGQRTQTVVGINPMPVYDRRFWTSRKGFMLDNVEDNARYSRYVEQLAHFSSRLMREGYAVFFFGTQPSDEPVIHDVIARLDRDIVAAGGTSDRVRRSNTVAEVLHVVESADVVVATRFHGAVLALHACRPVLGICYHRKTREVLRERGQEAYALDLDELNDAALWRVFESLAINLDEEARKIERKGEEVRALLAEQYDSVLEMLGASIAAAAPTAGAGR